MYRTRYIAAELILFSVFATPLAATEIGNAKRGADVFMSECSTCHEVGLRARNRIGPQLNRLFGRRAADIEGFTYSNPMKRMGADGLTWTLETLHAYIENPRALVSGTRMSYRGLKDEAERSALLAYLRDFSDEPQNIPEAEPTAISSAAHVSPEVLAIVGDVAFGEYLASECLTCHRHDGSDQGIPSIVAWPEEDFVAAMHAYRQELRPHPVMQMMAKRLNNEEIAALAAYFATLD
ncbi:c-type cytochrome [Celeribacter sp. ULVN23_4]